jgi:hypothetical protein
MSDFASNFKKYFSLVSYLSINTILRNVWYVNSGASRHTTSTQELFSSLTEKDSRVWVELGDDAKYLVAGVGTIPFQLQSGNSLDFDNILFVLGLRKNLFLVLVMEDKGYALQCCTEWEHFRESESRECHFPKILGSGASRERYIYIAFIFKKKHVERQVSCRIYDIMKTCTFVH